MKTQEAYCSQYVLFMACSTEGDGVGAGDNPVLIPDSPAAPAGQDQNSGNPPPLHLSPERTSRPGTPPLTPPEQTDTCGNITSRRTT